jgi:NADH:ubiquinone oxidoreductase subunit B-like Fe-S oxidoreductase
MGLEDLHHNFLTGTLEDLGEWARYRSMWPVAVICIVMARAGYENHQGRWQNN